MKPDSVKQWAVIVLVYISGAVTFGWASAHAAATVPGSPPPGIFAEDLRDSQVLSAEGGIIGVVEDLVIETDGAEVAYIVVRIDPIYAFGKMVGGPQNRFLFIPWSHITLDAARHELITDRRATELAAAALSRRAQPTTPAWDEKIRRFWAEH